MNAETDPTATEPTEQTESSESTGTAPTDHPTQARSDRVEASPHVVVRTRRGTNPGIELDHGDDGVELRHHDPSIHDEIVEAALETISSAAG